LFKVWCVSSFVDDIWLITIICISLTKSFLQFCLVRIDRYSANWAACIFSILCRLLNHFNKTFVMEVMLVVARQWGDLIVWFKLTLANCTCVSVGESIWVIDLFCKIVNGWFCRIRLFLSNTANNTWENANTYENKESKKDNKEHDEYHKNEEPKVFWAALAFIFFTEIDHITIDYPCENEKNSNRWCNNIPCSNTGSTAWIDSEIWKGNQYSFQ